MPFVFDNVQVAPGLTGGASPEAVALAARVSEAWIAFATRGDPNSKKSGLPPWPAYDSERRATMLFNNESKVVDDPSSEAAQNHGWHSQSGLAEMKAHAPKLSAFVALIATVPLSAQYKYPFQNPDLDREQRITNILSLMTLDEKIAALGTTTAVPRLGYPRCRRL